MVTAQKLLFSSIKYLLYVVCLIIIALGAAGAYVPKDLDKYKKVGYFQIRPYKYGVYLTQKDSGIFYNFSPFNDYLASAIPKDFILKYDSNITSEESVKQNDFIDKYEILADSIKSYLGFYEPKATFKFANNQLVYKTSLLNNRLSVEYLENIDSSIIHTMSLNNTDIVYDSFGNVYSNTDPETISLFNNVYKKTLNTEIKLWNIDNKPEYIYIFNPETNGQITITRENKNYKINNLDMVNLLIEFNTSEQNTFYMDLSEQI